MPHTEIRQNFVRSARHATFYLEAGPVDGTPVFFVHGWPELSISWRHQLTTFAALGLRAIAPDMRGYGRSSVPTRHEDYRVECLVQDMIELADANSIERAIWVGHDWGSPVVWSLASHFPERCHAIANLCLPYFPAGFALDNVVPLVDRSIYPESQYPAGQWEYWCAYKEDFAAAQRALESNPYTTIKSLFRAADPALIDQPSITAHVRRQGGWGKFLSAAGELPMDERLLTREDLHAYASALQRNGFFGADSYYMNDEHNIAYAKKAKDGGRITIPALFIAGDYDSTLKIHGSRLADPMRAACANLAECSIESGHWMAQEKPVEVNAALVGWIARELPHLWPGARGRSATAKPDAGSVTT